LPGGLHAEAVFYGVATIGRQSFCAVRRAKGYNLPMKRLTLAIFAFFLGACQSVAQMQSLGSRDTFAAAKLSAREAQEVIDAVEISAYDTPDFWKKELRVKRVDLGSYPGLVVQGSNLLCGATGNCQLWIFRKAGGKWLSMFGSDQAPIAEGFQLGPARSQGVKDLAIAANSSAEASQRVTYKFDGKQYRAK